MVDLTYKDAAHFNQAQDARKAALDSELVAIEDLEIENKIKEVKLSNRVKTLEDQVGKGTGRGELV